MQKTSFIKELVKRRVPQILGLYIAATWMMIEIGDWMTERFSMPQEITSYIFVGMAFFIPSVFYLAYQYGKPGRDPWKKPTFVFVPGNLLLAFGAMFYLVNPVAATETKVIVDEKGVAQAYEIPKQEFHKSVVTYFWKNKSGQPELDWMQYGIPWMLSKDLDRSLFISSYTPFDSSSMLRKMKKVGYADALNVPNSMRLEMARKRFTKFSVSGNFEFRNDEYELSIDIFDVKKGLKMAAHAVKGKNLLSLVDELSSAIRKTLEIPQNLNEHSTDLAVAEHVSESIPAIEKFVESQTKRRLENNFPEAKLLAEQAIKEDFSFAHAYFELSTINRLMGKVQDGAKALADGLKHEYKFTTQDKFRLRASTYAIKGDYVSQVKIYDMWLELFPDDIHAHELRSEILLVTGIDHDKALESLRRLRQLNPSDDSVLRKLTKLFVLRGELEKASQSQLEYVSLNPSDVNGLVELANVFERSSQFEDARSMLERALLLENANLGASLKLVTLDMKTDRFDNAERRLSELMDVTENSIERYQILSGYLSYYTLRGEITKAIATLDSLFENSEHLSPIVRSFTIQFPKSQFLAYLGLTEEALSLLDEVKSSMQPPYDSIADLGILNVYVATRDKEKLKLLLENVEESLRRFPNPLFISALDGARGQIMEMEENYEEALKFYQRAYDAMANSVVNTMNETSIYSIGVLVAKVKHKSGFSAEAKESLLKILEKYPTLPTAHLELAHIYFDNGEREKFDEAINRLSKVWANADENYSEYKRFSSLKEKAKSTGP
ncbi:tetratricopeptide repeat protein [Aliikangiella coralliicola]|uniref:Tetratricopeptide repeat protein n=1 Tax=Aliikangiella coralliicola TaxID=2592383 RepID=A0A545U7D1_9GAMM|nr:tetratricopeptide repeat protein [Aliikangiella coralliicola]TQV85376.1 hypothetical protein FLL46_19615 [Aliikangiella coralliicola]